MHIENVPVEIQYSRDHCEYKAIFFAIEKGINIQKDLLNKNCSGKFQKNLLSPRQNRPYPTQKCDFFICLFCVLECPDHFWFWSTKNGGQNVKWRPSSQREDKFGQFGRTRRTKCQKGGCPPNGRTCGVSVKMSQVASPLLIQHWGTVGASHVLQTNRGAGRVETVSSLQNCGKYYLVPVFLQ